MTVSNFENLTGGAIKAAMRDAGASSSDLWMVSGKLLVELQALVA